MYIRKFTESERKIIDTKHSLERYLQRYSDIFSKEQIDTLIHNVEKIIISNYKDIEGQYGWHSKSTGAGGIITWRKDYHNPSDKRNHSIITSLFPIKKFHIFKDVNATIIIEKHVIEWAKEKGFKQKFKEGFCESYFDKEEDYEDEFYVNFFEGKLYDFQLDGYIIID